MHLLCWNLKVIGKMINMDVKSLTFLDCGEVLGEEGLEDI